MEPDLVTSLVIYGPLGIMTLVSMLITRKLYDDKQAQSDAHKKELQDLAQRYIERVEAWAEKNHELVRSMNNVLDSFQKLIEQKKRG